MDGCLRPWRRRWRWRSWSRRGFPRGEPRGWSLRARYGPIKLRARALDLRTHEAIIDVIVDEAHRLHEGITGGRTDEGPATLFEILRQGDRALGRAHDRVPGNALRPALRI